MRNILASIMRTNPVSSALNANLFFLFIVLQDFKFYGFLKTFFGMINECLFHFDVILMKLF